MNLLANDAICYTQKLSVTVVCRNAVTSECSSSLRRQERQFANRVVLLSKTLFLNDLVTFE